MRNEPGGGSGPSRYLRRRLAISFVYMPDAVLRTDLPFPVRRGKVRDVYDLGDTLLVVATDRISAFDVVMPNGIPGKGRTLTALSLFWFDYLRSNALGDHLISADVEQYPSVLKSHADTLRGRSMWVKKASVVPIECVARGYLAGSGWVEYQKSGTVCGVKLPAGLRQCEELKSPIFTPAAKAETGHDQNIDFATMVGTVGSQLATTLRDHTLRLYTRARDYARTRGIIIADTKFEFGKLPDGSIILIDEVLTPDSSRFWPVDGYEPGHDQPSFDKQFVRNWLATQAWDKTPPGPVLPEDVVAGTLRRYQQAYEMLAPNLKHQTV